MSALHESEILPDVQEDAITGEEAGSGAEERTFTQAQINAIVAREKTKATKGLVSAEDMAAKDATIATLTSERDTARADLQKAQDELESFKREKILTGKGVPAEDVEFYSFKIAKLVNEDTTFEQSTDMVLAQYPPRASHATRISTGGSLAGGTPHRAETPNEKINKMLRGAYYGR